MKRNSLELARGEVVADHVVNNGMSWIDTMLTGMKCGLTKDGKRGARLLPRNGVQ